MTRTSRPSGHSSITRTRSTNPRGSLRRAAREPAAPGGEGKFSPAQLLQLASDVGRLLSADNGGGSPGKAEWFFLTVRVEAAGGATGHDATCGRP